MNHPENTNTLIISPKASGNTYKVAAYMAQACGADLMVLERGEKADLRSYSHICLCSGVYGDKIHGNLVGWLQGIRKELFQQDVTFHVFLTWFGRGKSDRRAMVHAVTLLEEHQLPCNLVYGSCYGGKFFLRKGRPNQQDLLQAAQWLKQWTNA